ncbi:hypothetical protein [Campylobacter majalis]
MRQVFKTSQSSKIMMAHLKPSKAFCFAKYLLSKILKFYVNLLLKFIY